MVDHAEIPNSASEHGDHLFQEGLTVGQSSTTTGTSARSSPGSPSSRTLSISAEDFQTLNLCLDDAIAGAVTAFSQQRERAISDEGTERLGVLAHELRNALNSAMLSFGSIKKGLVATGGSTGAMLERSHLRLQSLIDRSLADVRLDAGLLNLERVPVWEVIEEAEIGASVVAQARGLHFAVTTVDRTVIVEADRPILAAALANLLQNAFKFTRPGTTVKLRASTTDEPRPHRSRGRVRRSSRPGRQRACSVRSSRKARDRTGMGLGLSICLKAVKTMAGELHIRDLPGKGCVFTIDLPRLPLR